MDDGDRGWPLCQHAIQARYRALESKDGETRCWRLKSKHLGYDAMLQQLPATLSRSQSIREAYSRSRNLQRMLRRAGLADMNGRGSQSVPVSSPSSSDSQPEAHASAPHDLSGLNIYAIGSVEEEDPVASSSSTVRSSVKLEASRKDSKPTMFLAKQFKMISNSANRSPRRNIKILGKAHGENYDEASFTVCSAETTSAAEKSERGQLENRMQMHDRVREYFDDSAFNSSTENFALQCASIVEQGSLSKSPGRCLSNSCLSKVESELSVPETILSATPDNRTGCRSKLSPTKSQELFGSFDVEELGIIEKEHSISSHSSSFDQQDLCYSPGNSQTLPASTNPGHHDASKIIYLRFSDLVYVADESLNSSSSDAYSPVQYSDTSSQEWSANRDHNSGRSRQRSRILRRMKVTSPSSLFRDGPHDNGVEYRKPRGESSTKAAVPNQRKPSRKMVPTSSHPNANPSPNSNSTPPPKMEASYSQKTLHIAGMFSSFRSAEGCVSISQKEAVAAFQDDIAHMMLEEQDSDEVADIEEFLDGYMHLKSPFYLEVVEEFFRAISYDCYHRP